MSHFPKLLSMSIFLFHFSSCLMDFDPPMVIQTSPEHGSENVNITDPILIQFSENMDKESVETSFQLTASADTSGTFIWYSGSEVAYLLRQPMKPGIRYSILLSGEAQDKAGNRMGKDTLFAFHAGSSQRLPYIIWTSPANLQEGITGNSNLVVVFSHEMDISSVEANLRITPDIQGSITWSNNRKLVFMPYYGWELGKRYYVQVGSDAMDTSGLKIGEQFGFSFYTGAEFENPIVLGISKYGDTRLPLESRCWTNGEFGLEKNISFAIHFNSPMNRRDTESAFSTIPSRDGWFEWISTETETLVFHPNTPYESEQDLKIKIDKSAANTVGIPLGSDYQLSVRMDGPFSRFLQCTQISTPTGIPFSFSDVNNLHLGTTHTNSIVFLFNLVSPNELQSVSLQNNVDITRFAGSGDTSFSGSIQEMNYLEQGKKVRIRFGDLSTNNFYRITISGEKNGVKDSFDNQMKGPCILVLKTVR